MPEDQRQLWDLLPLFAELQQGSLACVLVQQISDVLKGPAVVFGDGLERGVLSVGLRQGIDVIVSTCDAIIMLLLLNYVGSGGSSSGLSMVLLLLVVGGLLVHPSRVGLGVLVVAVTTIDSMLTWHHLEFRERV